MGVAQSGAGGAQGADLGVRRRVVLGLAGIGGLGEDRPLRREHDSAHRHLPRRARRPGQLQGAQHGGVDDRAGGRAEGRLDDPAAAPAPGETRPPTGRAGVGARAERARRLRRRR